MMKKTKMFAGAACGFCGLYACTPMGGIVVDPFDTKRDATPVLTMASTSADTGPTYVTIYDPTLEVEYRTDMPNLIAVTVKPTKQST
jgi:hypothetical protein